VSAPIAPATWQRRRWQFQWTVALPVVLSPYSFPFCSTKPSPSKPNNLEHHRSLLASMAA
jgi:hypothetical protein